MSADTTPSLAPCPWCGEVPDAALDVRGTAIECPSCGTRGPAGRDAAEAVEAWQRRIPQPAVAWLHEEDPTRVISAPQRETARRDGGASWSSVRGYTIPLVRRP